MLPIKSRLNKESFQKVLKEGVFMHSTGFYLKFLGPASPGLRGTNIPLSMFAFVVPNKVKKTSVGRHLIKRRASAVVEKHLSSLKPGLSIIIFAKKDVSTLPYKEIEVEIMELLKKAKLVIE
jgi:ribonuclease P protein component